ncbi:MAG: hypothetical protein M1833_000127 [Piccolia ochrophora]|nr:MAG: hypothetical protein M1833_000127 [Piccolia ochrophora]
MKLPLHYIQKCKVALHVIQGLFIFVAWALTLVVLISKGPDSGRTGFFFALCWLSIPALIYQVMVPMWPRAKKFANPYAFAGIDLLFMILWFAAFISVATWNSAGIKAGEKDKKKHKDAKGCDAFDFGSPRRCNVSRGSVVIGVFIFLLFVLASAISVYSAVYFRKNGALPGAVSDFPSVEAQTKDAFSSNQDEEDDGSYNRPSQRHRNRQDDEYGLLHSNEGDQGQHPGRPVSWGHEQYPPNDHNDTPYNAEYDDQDYHQQSPEMGTYPDKEVGGARVGATSPPHPYANDDYGYHGPFGR